MRSITATLLVWMMAAPLQFAQQPAGQRTAQQAPQTGTNSNGLKTFNLGGVTTQLVVEDVIIKSKDGNPVTGLKASDFTITEDGKPQDISVFEFQKLEDEAVAQPDQLKAREPETAKAEAPKAPEVKAVTGSQIAPEKPGDIKYKDK